MKIKICLITKNKFFLSDDKLISNGFLFYEDLGILGFRKEEIEKLVFIGFKANNQFDGYEYNLGSKDNVFVVGPNYREEKRYILDRLINIFLTLNEIWKNRKVFKDLDIIFAPFFEYVIFEFLFLKLIGCKAKFILYIIGDYPEWNFRKRRNLLLKIFLLISQKLSQKMSNEVWILSKYLYKKYKSRNSILLYNSSLRKNQIGSQKKLNSQMINLLFVGRFEKEKRPEITVLVLKKIKENNLRTKLHLIGDGSLKNEIIKLVKDLEVENDVIFYGWIKEREKLFGIYKISDFVVFPSMEGEGLGFVILEALSQGLVVLATKCGGPEEIINNGINGFLIDQKSEEEIVSDMVAIIKDLIKNPKKFEEISLRAIETAKKWTIEDLILIQKERILNLLKDKK